MNRTQLKTAYRLISELFLHPEHRDKDMISASMEALAQAGTDILTPFQTFLSTPSASDTKEYVSTLELAPPIPLYLGAHLFEEPKSCRGAGISGRNGYMMELANIYRHFGVEFDGPDLADFVPVVAEFLALSLDRGDKDQIGLRRYMVESLIVNSLEGLLSAMRKHDSPYEHLVNAFRVALADDIEKMAGGPKWIPPVEKQDQMDMVPNCGMAQHAQETLNIGVEL